MGHVVLRVIAPARVNKVGENHLANSPALDEIQDVGEFGIIPTIQRRPDLRRKAGGLTIRVPFQDRIEGAGHAPMAVHLAADPFQQNADGVQSGALQPRRQRPAEERAVGKKRRLDAQFMRVGHQFQQVRPQQRLAAREEQAGEPRYAAKSLINAMPSAVVSSAP